LFHAAEIKSTNPAAGEKISRNSATERARSVRPERASIFRDYFSILHFAPVGTRITPTNHMRWRGLFFVALGINLVLGTLCLHWVPAPPHARNSAGHERELLVKTNVVVRKQFFSWSQIESTDYSRYIANLRDIGCPEPTIRDIIIADVNSLFARRMGSEVTTPEQQWWRSEPDTRVLRAAVEKLRGLESERRRLLTQLLGASWEAGDLNNLPRPSRRGVKLDGPVLSQLSAELKDLLQAADTRAGDRSAAYLAARQAAGLAPDPAELGRLRKQAREDLAHILTPPQLEDYMLRNSTEADNLRTELGELKFFNATPEEFRAMFHAADAYNSKILTLTPPTDAAGISERQSLEQQRETTLKTALGAERYELLQLLQDPVYRDAFAAAQRAGNPAAARTLYEISQTVAEQEAALRSKTNWTPEQLAIALQRAKLEQLKANAQALGQDLPEDPSATAPTPTAPRSPPNAPIPFSLQTHPHVLGIGENEGSLSTLYGVSISALRAANPDVNLRKLRPGDSVLIPNRPSPTGP